MLIDLLHLSRNLGRSPASAAAAILTLSLMLGAAAAILAVVHAVLLTPPPRARFQLVKIWLTRCTLGGPGSYCRSQRGLPVGTLTRRPQWWTPSTLRWCQG
jgi:hypothetical protein